MHHQFPGNACKLDGALLTNGAIHVAGFGQSLEHRCHRPGDVRHGTVAAARCRIVQMLADVGRATAQQQPGGRRLADVLVLGAAQHRVALDFALIFEEELVRLVDEMLDVDDVTERRDNVVLRYEGENHQGFDDQLAVLGLGDGVEGGLDLRKVIWKRSEQRQPL